MSKKIMVIDDEPDILFTVGQMLELSGYEIIKAKSGDEAIKTLTDLTTNPDLILLDIMMPEISGWDVAAKIKENPRWKDIPIVFLTARTDNVAKNAGGFLGEDYVEKPFEIKDLKERIDKILG